MWHEHPPWHRQQPHSCRVSMCVPVPQGSGAVRFVPHIQGCPHVSVFLVLGAPTRVGAAPLDTRSRGLPALPSPGPAWLHYFSLGFWG